MQGITGETTGTHVFWKPLFWKPLLKAVGTVT
jgi:hypothetical protein